MNALSLTLLFDLTPLSVCRLDHFDQAPPRQDRGIFCLIQAADEVALVCPTTIAPAAAKIPAREDGWVAFTLAGTFPFDAIGIMACVINPLRDAGVSVMTYAAFTTDFVLIKQSKLDIAINALRQAGHQISGV
jgi:uncharacterized protein